MNTKADYVDIELIVNQRGDKFVGVGFGEGLEETQKATKDRVENPPKLNVIVPVVVNDEKNIRYIGLVLRYKATKNNITNFASMSDDQVKITQTAYNGSGDAAVTYGKETFGYYEIFKKYNKGELK